MRRAAWIILGGVVYVVAMSALGRYLGERSGDYGTDTLAHPPPYRAGAPEWDR